MHIGNSKSFRKRHNFASWTSTDSLLSNKLCVAVVLFASVLRNDSGKDGACDAKGKKKILTTNPGKIGRVGEAHGTSHLSPAQRTVLGQMNSANLNQICQMSACHNHKQKSITRKTLQKGMITTRNNCQVATYSIALMALMNGHLVLLSHIL